MHGYGPEENPREERRMMYLVESTELKHEQKNLRGQGDGPREDSVSAKPNHKQKCMCSSGEGPKEDNVPCGVC